MAGRHEPGSSGSFYISLATAALRVGLVIAAVVLGVFVLSKAFPTSGETESPQGSGGPATTVSEQPSVESPTVEETTPPPEEEVVDLQGVPVQVQNGTSSTGLAAETADRLKKQLGLRIREIGNAERSYDVTTLFFAQGARATAEAIRDQFFDGSAELDRMPADTADVDVIIVLGEDFAATQG